VDGVHKTHGIHIIQVRLLNPRDSLAFELNHMHTAVIPPSDNLGPIGGKSEREQTKVRAPMRGDEHTLV